MRASAVLVALALVVGGCAAAPEAPVGRQQDGGLSGTVTVLAAASLTDTFTALGAAFETEHPDVTVVLSFGGSSGLAAQVVSGAPADVLASASPTTTAAVVEAGAARGAPVVFARNTLQIVVPAGNPAGVTGLADLADPELTVALCAAQVPCGAASEKVFAAAGLAPAPDTLEQDVRAVLTKVELGEVDAGLVYRTDVIAAGDAVEGIDLPDAEDAVNDYPVVVLADAPNPDAAQAFVDLVLSEQGREVLAGAGFTLP